MAKKNNLSEFFLYLSSGEVADFHRLPSLQELSRMIGVNIGRLREQLEVARALGLVEVKPRTGIRRIPYSFAPAVRQSLFYVISLSSKYFDAFSDLRVHLETAYWRQAVEKLCPEDIAHLNDLVVNALKKLDGSPVQIPHEEHKELHLTIFRRLNNVFLTGLLEVYWDIYEAVGFSVYTDLDYLQRVWAYHAEIVKAIQENDFEKSFQLYQLHTQMIYQLKDSYPGN